MTGEQKHNISDLLQRLNSTDASAAWAVFIDLFSALIMKTVSQFDYRQDRSNECFLTGKIPIKRIVLDNVPACMESQPK